MERWTIRERLEGRYDRHLNATGPYGSGFGRFDYIATFDSSVEYLAIVLPSDRGNFLTGVSFPSLKKGVQRGWDLLREHGEIVTSLVIEIPSIRLYIPDPEGLGSVHGMALLADLISKHGTRSSVIEPAWLVWNWSTVPTLAKLIRADRKFELLPILADALEEAGCADTELLDHLRAALPHTDNCWVLDLILGKE